MPRLKVSPTRSNYLVIKQRLALAREGYRLLDKKRDVLIMEILRVIEDAERIQKQVENQFQRAYEIVQEARAIMGTERVRRLALSRTEEVDIHITPRSVMGVVVPSVTYVTPEKKLRYGFGDTSVILDQVQQEWKAVLDMMGELAETVTTVWRLATELRRTQRRVNALEHIFIPSYEETLAYIEEMLEEKEREELFRMKLTKTRKEKEGSQEGL
ncbi:MAG: V-type ATP synthase subunit D [Anaerolineae bacterium]|nr:V-type ATP synthase subunit D [Anaerolineae bacterium]